METVKKTELFYFGTDDRQPGHYIWTCGTDNLQSTRTYFGDLPFNPESIANKDRKNPYSSTGLSKGDVKFFKEGGCSICYIEGAPADSRLGCKSVWWIVGDVSNEQLKSIILGNKPSIILINKMEAKFKINWP